MSSRQLLQQRIAWTLVLLLLAGCSKTQTEPSTTLAPPTATSEPSGATIIGQIARLDEQPRTQLVIPCLIVEDGICQVQSEVIANVLDDGSFRISNIAPGEYTFLYGPASAESTRALWEDKRVSLDSPEAFAQSFNPDAEPVGCRSLETPDEPDEETGLYPLTIFDTVWVDIVSLQIDVPGGFEWKQGAMTLAGTGAPLQLEVMEGGTANVTLRGLGCENE